MDATPVPTLPTNFDEDTRPKYLIRWVEPKFEVCIGTIYKGRFYDIESRKRLSMKAISDVTKLEDAINNPHEERLVARVFQMVTDAFTGYREFTQECVMEPACEDELEEGIEKMRIAREKACSKRALSNAQTYPAKKPKEVAVETV